MFGFGWLTRFAESDRARLNRLETDMEQLQLESADRQLAVLNASERVLHQLEARERKRERTAAEGVEPHQAVAAPAEQLPVHPDMIARRRKARGF